jgi:hypothetical protein
LVLSGPAHDINTRAAVIRIVKTFISFRILIQITKILLIGLILQIFDLYGEESDLWFIRQRNL